MPPSRPLFDTAVMISVTLTLTDAWMLSGDDENETLTDSSIETDDDGGGDDYGKETLTDSWIESDYGGGGGGEEET